MTAPDYAASSQKVLARAPSTRDPSHPELEFKEFTDGAARAGRGQIADPVPELDQPDYDGAGHVTALDERGDDRERVEYIDVETSFPPPYAPGAQCDRIGVPQHQRHVDGTHDGIGLKAISSDTVGSARGVRLQIDGFGTGRGRGAGCPPT